MGKVFVVASLRPPLFSFFSALSFLFCLLFCSFCWWAMYSPDELCTHLMSCVLTWWAVYSPDELCTQLMSCVLTWWAVYSPDELCTHLMSCVLTWWAMYSPAELCTHLMSCVLTLLSITSGMVLLVFFLHMGIWNKRNWPPPYTSKVTWLTINWFCSLVTPFASSIVNGVCGAGRFHFPVQYLCFSGTTVLTKSCIFFLAKFLSFRGDQQLNLFFSSPSSSNKDQVFFWHGGAGGCCASFSFILLPLQVKYMSWRWNNDKDPLCPPPHPQLWATPVII